MGNSLQISKRQLQRTGLCATCRWSKKSETTCKKTYSEQSTAQGSDHRVQDQHLGRLWNGTGMPQTHTWLPDPTFANGKRSFNSCTFYPQCTLLPFRVILKQAHIRRAVGYGTANPDSKANPPSPTNISFPKLLQQLPVPGTSLCAPSLLPLCRCIQEMSLALLLCLYTLSLVNLLIHKRNLFMLKKSWAASLQYKSDLQNSRLISLPLTVWASCLVLPAQLHNHFDNFLLICHIHKPRGLFHAVQDIPSTLLP